VKAAGHFIGGVLESAVAALPLSMHFEHDSPHGRGGKQELGEGE